MKGINWEVIEWGAAITDDNVLKTLRSPIPGEHILKVFDDDGNYYATAVCKDDRAAEEAHDVLSASYGSTSSTYDGEPFIG